MSSFTSKINCVLMYVCPGSYIYTAYIDISHCLLVHYSNALSPGMLCPRKRFPQGDIQEHLLAKQVVRCAWTGTEGVLQSMSATGSALVVCGT